MVDNLKLVLEGEVIVFALINDNGPLGKSVGLRDGKISTMESVNRHKEALVPLFLRSGPPAGGPSFLAV